MRRPGSSWGFAALLKSLTSVVDNARAEIRTHNLGLPVQCSIHVMEIKELALHDNYMKFIFVYLLITKYKVDE